ncbi:MAG: HAMP domain-containing histidine kinase [Clostridia bacterium]|nr:HAMP domain-containing histidine kinase [Clostridia bacterium]
MLLLSWSLTGVFAVVILLLLLKLYLLRKSAGEIADAFAEHLREDTNTLIGISSRDRTMCRLAAAVNEQLRILRRQRQRYLTGDRELKEAVTNISHDLRTPLTAICGYLDLLEREEKSPEVSHYLSMIAGRAETMKQLTEELFRYSVILSAEEELPAEPVNICGVLEEAIAGMYAVLTGRGIIPVIDLPEEPVMRMLNRAALSRIFGNILNNAVKYSGGDLEIHMEETGTITFSNTAAGLTEIQVGRLFDRFFTVEAARNSTGLGLSIAKTLTERMGGTITAGYRETKLTVTVIFNG